MCCFGAAGTASSLAQRVAAREPATNLLQETRSDACGHVDEGVTTCEMVWKERSCSIAIIALTLAGVPERHVA